MDRLTSTGHETTDQEVVWDPDATEPVHPRTRGTFRRPLAVSIPGAIVGGFLVCALAFGSSLGTSRSDTSAATAAAGADAGGAGQGATGGDNAWLGDGSGALGAFVGITAQTEQGDEIPESAPGTEPATDPAAEPGSPADPSAEPAAMDLGLGLRGRDVKVTWAVCDVDGFVAYRIIRSTDALVTYPRAEGDTLVAEIEDAGRNHFVDENAPAGKRLWYAVFGIARSDGESYVACASAVESIATPAAPEPTKTPAPKETSAPAEPASLGLALVLHEGHPSLDWTPCVVDGADAYKVVRSTDSTVRWPLGEHDTLVKVVGMDGTTAFVDGDAPAGTRVWYRVFCIRHVGDGYQVVAASPAKSIETPNPEPSPEPQALSLEIASEGGYAVLHWETCTADPFSHYRIVRTASEGPSVVKEIESRSTTSWTDETVVVGETYHFTVQCKGHVGNSYPLLGTSDPVAVTIE